MSYSVTRKIKRFKTCSKASIRRKGEKEALPVYAFDVSERGFGFDSEEVFDKEEKCIVNFILEGEEVFETEPIKATVKWVIKDGKKSKLGIEFVEILTEKEYGKFFKYLDNVKYYKA